MRNAIYFLSDFHLPVFRDDEAINREKKIITFLDSIAPTAKEIFLLGDIFDFWFEYKYVIPKHYVRLLGCLAKLSDSGILIHYFVGNHDMWQRDYFEKELGIKVYFKAEEFHFNGQSFLIGHGDGLGPKQWKYKALKRFVFQNKFIYPLFIRLFHADWLMPIGSFWSRLSRQNINLKERKYLGEHKEYLVQFCKKYLEKKHIHYFVFGHRHLALALELQKDSWYYNTGDLININSYVVYQDMKMSLEYLK